jgi:hypothetical protein
LARGVLAGFALLLNAKTQRAKADVPFSKQHLVRGLLSVPLGVDAEFSHHLVAATVRREEGRAGVAQVIDLHEPWRVWPAI